MLFIPVGQDRAIRKMPYVTIALMAILCLIHIYVEMTIRAHTQKFERVQSAYDHTLQKLIKIYIDTYRRDGVEYTDPDLMEYALDFTKNLPEKAVKAANEENLLTEHPELENEWNHIRSLYEKTKSGHVFLKFGFIPVQIRWYTWVTSLFLHANIVHLLANLIFFWFAGINLEDRWGSIFYLFFYLAGGIASNAGHMLAYPYSDVPAIGASGAIAALMGGLAARYPKMKTRIFWLWVGFTYRCGFITIPAYIGLAAWLAVQIVLYAFQFGNIAYMAHISGFAFGFGTTLLLMITRIDKLLDRYQQYQIENAEFKTEFTLSPMLQKGMNHLANGNHEKARKMFTQYIHQNPDVLDGHRFMALLSQNEKNSKQAAFYLTPLIRKYLKQKLDDQLIGLLEEFNDSAIFRSIPIDLRIQSVNQLIHRRDANKNLLEILLPSPESCDGDTKKIIESMRTKLADIDLIIDPSDNA